jgi:hypothetical protein
VTKEPRAGDALVVVAAGDQLEPARADGHGDSQANE